MWCNIDRFIYKNRRDWSFPGVSRADDVNNNAYLS
jgi:hypothetical protein